MQHPTCRRRSSVKRTLYMSPLPIRRFPDSLLKRTTHHVTQMDAASHRLIEAMIRAMRHHPRCVGLAAPQVGSDRRIAVMDASRHPNAMASRGLLILVNPQIDVLEEFTVQREGCLSVPDFTANVRRARRVHLIAQDQTGAAFDCWLEGFEAIVAQHEVDHLDGKLFLDRVVNLKTDVFRRKTYL